MAKTRIPESENQRTEPHADVELFREHRQLIRFAALPYLHTEGVTSVGIGYKQIGNRLTREVSVQFTVRRKLSMRDLRSTAAVPFPDHFALPGGRKIRVDVLERRYRLTPLDPDAVATLPADPLAGLRRSRMDPIRPGASIGRVGTGAGTIAAVVYGANNTPYLLSNWHVLAGPRSSYGDPVFQPGSIDDSDESVCVVGQLVRRHLSLAGDGAICSIQGRAFNPSILGLDVVPQRSAVAVLDDLVVKSGRTTGVTHGVIVRSHVVATLSYPQGDRDIGGFEIQRNAAYPSGPGGICEQGDSGSLWMVDAQPPFPGVDTAVGLQVCAAEHPDEQKEIALACNLHSILDKLKVSLVPAR